MKTIKLDVELTYDEDLMYGEDKDAKEWFFKDVLSGGLSLHSNEIGDSVGSIKVLNNVNRPDAFCETCGFDGLYNQCKFCPDCGRKL